MRNIKSKEYWKRHYDNRVNSGLSISVYSKNNNVNKSTFYGWIKKFKDTNSKINNSKSKVQWATLKTTPSSTTAIYNKKTTSSLNIVIGNASIEIKEDVNFEILDKVVKVLIKNV